MCHATQAIATRARRTASGRRPLSCTEGLGHPETGQQATAEDRLQPLGEAEVRPNRQVHHDRRPHFDDAADHGRHRD